MYISKQIAYPDLHIQNKKSTIEIRIYRKTTTADVTISSVSCHPEEHKMVTLKNLMHRLHKLPLNETNRVKEQHTVINFAEANEYTTNSK